MPFGFSAQLRLKNKSQFDEVFKERKKTSGKQFSLFLKPNNMAFPRLGIIIAKRAVIKAAERNRLKRVIRESFRLHQQDMIDYDIVFLAYKGLDALSNEELSECLERKWPRKK